METVTLESKIIDQLRQHPEWQQGASGNADYERVKSTLIGWLLIGA